MAVEVDDVFLDGDVEYTVLFLTDRNALVRNNVEHAYDEELWPLHQLNNYRKKEKSNVN